MGQPVPAAATRLRPAPSVGADGAKSFELMQQVGDRGTGALVYFAFDLLELDGASTTKMPLLVRKQWLAQILKKAPPGISYSSHGDGNGEKLRLAACKHGVEGIVSKRIDAPYSPGNRGLWVKSKCLNRAEFVIVGWSEPEGSRTLLELRGKLGDGVNQAADLISSTASIPSLNFTPLMTFGNWF
jgi:bifunctional non-homologous end joining protein LigD